MNRKIECKRSCAGDVLVTLRKLWKHTVVTTVCLLGNTTREQPDLSAAPVAGRFYSTHTLHAPDFAPQLTHTNCAHTHSFNSTGIQLRSETWTDQISLIFFFFGKLKKVLLIGYYQYFYYQYFWYIYYRLILLVIAILIFLYSPISVNDCHSSISQLLLFLWINLWLTASYLVGYCLSHLRTIACQRHKRRDLIRNFLCRSVEMSMTVFKASSSIA